MVAVASCSNTSDSPPSISCAEVRNWLEKTPVLKGEKWFVVCAQWFSRFIGQFEELSDTQFSPRRCGDITPIDNSELLDENRQIRRDLVLDLDYRIIPKECWDRLVSEYTMKKGQEPISVSIIQQGDALGPELYFYQVTLKRKNFTEKSVRSYSRTTTLIEIEQDMREFFGVPRTKFPEARLKLQPMSDCEWIPIEDKSVALMDTGASDSSVVMIEVEARDDVDRYLCWDDVIADSSEDVTENGSYDSMVPSPNFPSTVNGSSESTALVPKTTDGIAQTDFNMIMNDEDVSVAAEPNNTFGPKTWEETMEQQACCDISSVGLVATQSNGPEYKSGSNVDDSCMNGEMQVARPNVAIPLPYPGPLNPERDSTYQTGSSDVASSFIGPLPLGETSYMSWNEEGESDPGVCGLRNIGNSCYMNSAIQCLSNVKSLCQYFRSGEWEKDINTENSLGLKGDLATEYANLMDKLWSGKFKSLYPREMKRKIGLKNKYFMDSRQHDSQELMSEVLDGLHEDLKKSTTTNGEGPTENGDSDALCSEEMRAEKAKRKHRERENSRIVDLFHGYQKSTVVCGKCLNKSERFEPFNMLSLSLPGGNLCRLDITFVSSSQSKPVRHTVEVESTGTVLDLLTKVADITKSDVSRLWAAQISNYKVNQSLPANLSILSVRDLFHIYVYERQMPAVNGLQNGGDGEAMDECSIIDDDIIVNGDGDCAQNDKVVNGNGDCAQDDQVVNGNGDCGQDDQVVNGIQPVVVNMMDNLYNLPFGQPIVYFPSHAPTSISVEDLTEVILNQGSRYIKRPSPEDISERWWKERLFGPQPAPALCPISSSSNTSSLPDLRATSSADDERGAAATATATTTTTAVAMDDTNSEEAEVPPPMFTLSEVDDQGIRHQLEEGAVIKIPGNKMVRMTAIWHRRAKNKFYDDTEANPVPYASSSTFMSNSAKETSLDECLDLLTSEERLDGANAFECSKCPKTADGQLARCPATKKIDLWELPPVLILHFKRFTFLTHTTKPEIHVQIPITGLSLQSWLKGPQSNDLYDLVAVSNHSGRTLERGHYISLAKNWLDGKWYRFNDDCVTEVEPKIDGEMAYILVYVRRDMNDASVNGEEDMEIA